jgi:hypothetical protein
VGERENGRREGPAATAASGRRRLRVLRALQQRSDSWRGHDVANRPSSQDQSGCGSATFRRCDPKNSGRAVVISRITTSDRVV